MSTFQEKKARAKRAERQFKIVEVALDGNLSDERDALMAEIAEAAKDPREGYDGAAEARRKLDELEDAESDSLVQVKVYRSLATFWASLSQNLGYNTEKTLRAAIMTDARILDDGQEIVQTNEEWDEFFGLLAPSDYARITGAAYLLNEREPADRVERLKKVSAGADDSEQS